jgi:hypothetical protein
MPMVSPEPNDGERTAGRDDEIAGIIAKRYTSKHWEWSMEL